MCWRWPTRQYCHRTVAAPRLLISCMFVWVSEFSEPIGLNVFYTRQMVWPALAPPIPRAPECPCLPKWRTTPYAVGPQGVHLASMDLNFIWPEQTGALLRPSTGWPGMDLLTLCLKALIYCYFPTVASKCVESLVFNVGAPSRWR